MYFPACQGVRSSAKFRDNLNV